mmetsp:Transcript_6121/g.9840  ORF Transcript_6121/g.9840 Transcript_6121/m.9840 type:complete len:251 (-) Transcript_6121:439-1191(-)
MASRVKRFSTTATELDRSRRAANLPTSAKSVAPWRRLSMWPSSRAAGLTAVIARFKCKRAARAVPGTALEGSSAGSDWVSAAAQSSSPDISSSSSSCSFISSSSSSSEEEDSAAWDCLSMIRRLRGRSGGSPLLLLASTIGVDAAAAAAFFDRERVCMSGDPAAVFSSSSLSEILTCEKSTRELSPSSSWNAGACINVFELIGISAGDECKKNNARAASAAASQGCSTLVILFCVCNRFEMLAVMITPRY